MSVAVDAPTRWRWARQIGYVGYAAALVSLVVWCGVPTGQLNVAAIVLAGLALTVIGRDWRHVARLARDWLPFIALLVAYDQTRGLADALGISVHEADVLGAGR